MKNNYSNIFFILVVLLPAQIAFSQNVGIGTTAPADKLHVFGGQATIEGSSYPWLSFRNNNALKGYIGVNNNDVRIGTWPGNTTGHISLLTNNNTERLRIMGDGDVGIGLTNPQSLLHIANTSGPTQFTIGTNYTSGGYTALYMGTSSLSNGYGYIQGVRSSGTTIGDVVLNPLGGNIGIKTTVTRGIFDIGGNDEPVYLASSTEQGNQRIAYMPGNIFMAPWAGTNVAYLDARRTGSSSSPLFLEIRSQQNGGSLVTSLALHGTRVGVGHNDPKTDLDVDGDMLLRNSPVSDGISLDADDVFTNPSGTGLVFKYTILPSGVSAAIAGIARNGAYAQSSDSSLKKNISPIAPVLTNVLQLRPVRYQFKTDNDGAPFHSGFIAQEVERLYPDLVTGVKNSDGTITKMVNYDGFAVLAIKAIQEQQLAIQKLEKELNDIKEMLKKNTNHVR